jgi:hypothetical protein
MAQTGMFDWCTTCQRRRALCMVGAMANASHLPSADKPGPQPVFVHRMELRLRADQVQALTRIARVVDVSVSDLVRWFIDEGTAAVESAPTYETLKESVRG